MNISAVPSLIPPVQPQQPAAAQKLASAQNPVAPQPVTPVTAGDSDGDNDGSGGRGILA